MTTDTYNCWSIALQAFSGAVSVVVGIIIFWYTRETQKLRLATDKQLTLAQEQAKHRRTPFIMPIMQSLNRGGMAFQQSPLGAVPPSSGIHVRNSSEEAAIYVHFVLKMGDQYYFSRQPIEFLQAGGDETEVFSWSAPLRSEQIGSILASEYRQVPKDLVAKFSLEYEMAILAVFMNPKGEIFLTGREITWSRGNAQTDLPQNWPVSLLYP